MRSIWTVSKECLLQPTPMWVNAGKASGIPHVGALSHRTVEQDGGCQSCRFRGSGSIGGERAQKGDQRDSELPEQVGQSWGSTSTQDRRGLNRKEWCARLGSVDGRVDVGAIGRLADLVGERWAARELLEPHLQPRMGGRVAGYGTNIHARLVGAGGTWASKSAQGMAAGRRTGTRAVCEASRLPDNEGQ